MSDSDTAKRTRMRIAHYPQVRCNAYIFEVKNFKEAKIVAAALQGYDAFQIEKQIRPNYGNQTVFEVFDEKKQKWISWSDDAFWDRDWNLLMEE